MVEKTGQQLIALQQELDNSKEITQLCSEYDLKNPRKERKWNPRTFSTNELPEHVKRDPFIWQCFKRMHYENRNVLMVFVGETGAGKSEGAIWLADQVDITPLGNGAYKKNFVIKSDDKGNPSINTRVIFSAADFIRLIRVGLPKGSVIIWDEAGVGNDNTHWWERKSQIVKHIMQTFRKDNLMVILTVPDEESIQKGTRRLIHCVVDVEDRDNEKSECQIQWLQRKRTIRGKDKTGRTYRKTVAYEDSYGRDVKIASYFIPKLDKDIAQNYRKIKDRILDNWNWFYSKELKDMEEIENFELTKNSDAALDVPLKKFSLLPCMKLVDEVKETVLNDKGKPDSDKIIFLLAKKGFDCTLGNAKTIATNLVFES